jgi:hypothetical protein
MAGKPKNEHNLKAPPDRLLLRAAQLRAAGSTWEKVAAHVRRSVNTVQKWPLYYPRRWEALFSRAEQELVDEAAAESVQFLRKQLRSTDVKLVQTAAEKLMTYRVRLEKKRKPAEAKSSQFRPDRRLSREAVRVASYLESLNEAQEMELLARAIPGALAQLERYRAGGPAGGPADAGAVRGALPAGPAAGTAAPGDDPRGTADVPAREQPGPG